MNRMKTEKRENKNIRNYETREKYEKGDNLNHLQKQNSHGWTG